MQDFPGMVGVGRGTCGDGPQIVSSGDSVSVRAADTPGCLGGNPARTHGAVLTANTVFPELTMGRLIFVAILPGLRAHVTGYLLEFSGVSLHLLNGSDVVQCLQSLTLLKK
jgi:hypothetical protein